ncbi:MAG: SEC-C metal-binding domain-containing protein [Chloroflexi bacterium]|nr:SEC-C metal-binding domain-containing protein [Chloroflexota bacterium]
MSLAAFPRLVVATDTGSDVALHAYQRSEDNNVSLQSALSEACGFADLLNYIACDPEDPDTQPDIDFLREIWEIDIPEGFENLSEPADILSAFQQALNPIEATDNMPWRQGLLAELQDEGKRLAALRTAAGGRTFPWAEGERDFLLAATLATYRNTACRRLIAEASTVSDMWDLLVMKPWRKPPTEELLALAAAQPPEDAVRTLSDYLAGDLVDASCCLDVLNRLDSPGRFQLLLDLMDDTDEYSDIVSSEACQQFEKSGPQAASFMISRYDQLSPYLQDFLPGLLDRFPTPEVVDFCLSHLAGLLRREDSLDFVYVLGQIASPRFLEPLLQEWIEGESDIGEAIQLIAEVNDVKDQRIEVVIQDLARQQRDEGQPAGSPLISLPLRCTSCGRTFRYRIGTVHVSQDNELVLGDIIQCKGCGALESYQRTSESHLAMAAELARVASLRRSGEKKAPPDTPLKLGTKIEMKALGRNVKSLSEAYHLLKAEIEKHPRDADLQKRMGNLLKNGGKPDLALPYFMESLQLDAQNAESCAFIVEILIDQKRYQEAAPYLERLVPLCRKGRMDESLRRDMFSALLDQVYVVEKETGHHVDIFGQAAPRPLSGMGHVVTLGLQSRDVDDGEDFDYLYYTFRHGKAPSTLPGAAGHREPFLSRGEDRTEPSVRNEPKVGRNDPCPCGSGKKYKKCCGNAAK